MNHKSAGAWFAGGAILWIAFIISVVSVCAFALTPYMVETWAKWMGHTVILVWWQSLLIFITIGLLTRWGAVGAAVLGALITFIFESCGFTGL